MITRSFLSGRLFGCVPAALVVVGVVFGLNGAALAGSVSLKNPDTKTAFGTADITLEVDAARIVRSTGPINVGQEGITVNLMGTFNGGENGVNCDFLVSSAQASISGGAVISLDVNPHVQKIDLIFRSVPLFSKSYILAECRRRNQYFEGIVTFPVRFSGVLKLNPNCVIPGADNVINTTVNLPMQLRCQDTTPATVYNVIKYSCPPGFVIGGYKTPSLTEEYDVGNIILSDYTMFGLKRIICVPEK